MVPMARRPIGTPRRPHDEPAYRRYRAALKRDPQSCSVPGCPRPGDTVDHAPALALHDHVEGTGCCELRPMCRPHNSSFGRQVAARRSAARRAAARRETEPLSSPSRVW